VCRDEAPRIKSSSSTIATEFIFAFASLSMTMATKLVESSHSRNHTLVYEASNRRSPLNAFDTPGHRNGCH